MSKLMKMIVPLLGTVALLSACGTTGWGQKSSGSTHGLTGGAEAAPTSEATPPPARPRGESQSGMPGASPQSSGASGQSGPSGSPSGSSGDATTGGAEGAQTRP